MNINLQHSKHSAQSIEIILFADHMSYGDLYDWSRWQCSQGKISALCRTTLMAQEVSKYPVEYKTASKNEKSRQLICLHIHIKVSPVSKNFWQCAAAMHGYCNSLKAI